MWSESSGGGGEAGISHPRVTIIIPNWNGAHLLPACLDSLRNQTCRESRVVVVDNGSSDGSCRLLREHYPEVDVIALDQNVGFAAGVNAGIRACASEYVVLLNNDTEVAPDWLMRAVSELDRSPQYAFAASKILDFKDRELIDTVADGFSWFGVPFKVGEGERDCGQYEAPFEIFSACAAASFYRRSLFDDIGYFDEDFFAYVEDVDISIRAVLAGYRGVAIPAAKVFHIGTASSGGGPSAFTVRLSTRNVWWTMIKCMPPARLAVMLPASLVAQAALVAHTLLTDSRPWLRRNMPAYFAGLADAIRGLPLVLRKRKGIVRRVGASEIADRMRLAETQRRSSRGRSR